jgi:hypothetical protein
LSRSRRNTVDAEGWQETVPGIRMNGLRLL